MAGDPTTMTARAVRLSDRVLAATASTAAAVMVAVVIAEVVARYLLNTSIFFANELSRLMFVWVIFLGLPLALSRGRHVGIRLVEAALPPRVARQVFRATCLLAAVLMAVVMVKSSQLLVFNWMQRLQTLPFTASAFFFPVPVGSAFCILYLLIMARTAETVLVHDEDAAAG